MNKKTSTFRIRETQIYSNDNWANFCICEESFIDVFKLLFDNSVNIGNVIKLEKDQFQINFVGILIIDSYVFLCYPKYFVQLPYEITEERLATSYQRQIKQVIRVIKKTTELVQNYEDYFQTVNSSDYLPLQIWLLDDYMNNGIYTSHKTTLEPNGKNDIVWPKTIDSVNAHITKKRKPIYLNFWTKSKEKDSENIVRLIHAAIISEIIQEFTENSLLSIFAPNVDIDCREKRSNLGNDSKLSKLLQKEMQSQFNTQKRVLLEKMKAYIDNAKTSKNIKVQKYGVSKFNITWELVCKKLFADCLNEKMCDNEGHNANNCKYFTTTYKQSIGKPKWTISEIGNIDPYNITETEEEDNVTKEIKVIEKDGATLIPDIILRTDSELIVLDAKYYNPNWPTSKNDKINGVPGIGDITKQYLYQLIYDDFADSHGVNNRKNAFVMPVQLDDEEYAKRGNGSFEYKRIRHRGIVSLDLFKDFKSEPDSLSDIQVFEMDAETAFDAYLSESFGSRVNELIEVFEEVKNE